jgi:hypothetical protein
MFRECWRSEQSRAEQADGKTVVEMHNKTTWAVHVQ